MCQMPLRRPTFPALSCVSGEYRWFEIVPPLVIQLFVGRPVSSLEEKAGAAFELLLPPPPQPAASTTPAMTRKAVTAVVARRFIGPGRPFDRVYADQHSLVASIPPGIAGSHPRAFALTAVVDSCCPVVALGAGSEDRG
jgi:hypothetical protein